TASNRPLMRGAFQSTRHGCKENRFPCPDLPSYAWVVGITSTGSGTTPIGKRYKKGRLSWAVVRRKDSETTFQRWRVEFTEERPGPRRVGNRLNAYCPDGFVASGVTSVIVPKKPIIISSQVWSPHRTTAVRSGFDLLFGELSKCAMTSSVVPFGKDFGS